MEKSAIVVEDDANTALVLTKAIRSLGFSVRVASTLEQARALFRDDCPDLVLLDVTLPDGDGLELIREAPPELQSRFIIVTGDSRQEVAVRSLRARATDFLTKPITMADLRSVVAEMSIPDAANEELVTGSEKSRVATDTLPSSMASERGDVLLIGESHQVHLLDQAIKQLAITDTNVVITGEAGVDKISAAHALHRRTPGPGVLVHVQCATGHVIVGEKQWVDGFSDCLRMAFGRKPEQKHITLVLDNIDQLSKSRQQELLGYLTPKGLLDAESGARLRLVSIKRSSEPGVKLAGSAGSLDELLPDLSLCLCQGQLALPALRDRHQDIVLMAEKLLSVLNKQHSTDRMLSADSMETLKSYHWPGNVRELANAIVAAFNKGNPVLNMDNILSPSSDTDAMARSVDSIVGKTFWEVEKCLLQATLKAHEGNKKMAAQTLGISLKTLYNRLHAYSIGG